MTAGNSHQKEMGPLIFIIAGEPSGDQLGARLMTALKVETGGRIRFAGIGGERMAAEGLQSLFPIDELSVMGLVEVLPRVYGIYRRIKQTVKAVKAAQPAGLVTIDAPAFSLVVSRRLKGQGIPLIHYVAPSVWAWRPGRAKKIAGFLDHLLALLPFEPPYFEKHGLATTFVGHPAMEAINPAGVGGNQGTLRSELGIPQQVPLLCLLPGSRAGEVRRLAPVLKETLKLLQQKFPDLRAIVPTVRGVADDVAAMAESWPVPTLVLTGAQDKYKAFTAADVALAASGTVAVELAVAGTPAVVTYKLAWLTGIVGHLVLKVKYVSVPNIIAGREVQPEFLQEKARPKQLAKALRKLLDDPAARQAQIDAYREIREALSPGTAAPSIVAARSVLSVIGNDSGKR